MPVPSVGALTSATALQPVQCRAFRVRSVMWSLGITAGLCFLGWRTSMALAHGSPAVILYLPMLPVLFLFERHGIFGGAPGWVGVTAAAVAEFGGVLVVVHGIRLMLARRPGP